MTWKQASYLCLIVFSTLVELSQENCEEYFTVKEWENITELELVDLVIPENTTNVAECTLERYCLQDQMCDVLEDCFGRDAKTESDKCKSVLNATVHTYHLMCLLARVKSNKSSINGNTIHHSFCQYFFILLTLFKCHYILWGQLRIHVLTVYPFFSSSYTAGCEYESVCPLFEERRQVVSTPLPSTTTAPLPTSLVMMAITAQPNSIRHGQHPGSEASKSYYFLTLEILLVFVSILALVLPLAVYFHMRRQMTRDGRWQFGTVPTDSNSVDSSHEENIQLHLIRT
uniref:PIH1 domain-containing protein 1 isoform X4 n=1 Tax=Doryrhamphus excisus TaxID=161450 RepID=UPI0025AE2B0C|nr:PIH1 domain-containing protein 1 isoform X4 [Doryrhamphus excisus]